MKVHVHASPLEATQGAADRLQGWLAGARDIALMVAGGNTPLPLYAEIARRSPRDLGGLRVFVLDEYVGVPESGPRTCTNLLRRTVAGAWGVASERFHGLRSDETQALPAVVAHEGLIESSGGLDAIVLGLGQNGHIGFNEPGSERDSRARLVPLTPTSIEANRAWFDGEHAPSVGATVGLRTILAARQVLLLAFGENKAAAVRALRDGDGESCPAAWLRDHPAAHVYLDVAAASRLETP